MATQKITTKQNWQNQQAKIADAFSFAASQYHQHDKLQQQTAQLLISHIQNKNSLINKQVCLDIGAGPGTDFKKNKQYKSIICIDIAMGMLKVLQQNFPQYDAICANASKLPIASTTIDMVYSNLALQWSECLTTALNEVHRVLQPQGQCHLSIPIFDSLNELEVLNLSKNDFVTEAELKNVCQQQNWAELTVQIKPIVLYFNDIKSLLYSVKGIGASTRLHSQNNKEKKGLKGRKYWHQLVNKFEALRTTKGIPLSYNIALIHGIK